MLTSDGVEVGRVDQLVNISGSPPCLVLALAGAARTADASTVVTTADVAVEDGHVRLLHVAHRDVASAPGAGAAAEDGKRE